MTMIVYHSDFIAHYWVAMGEPDRQPRETLSSSGWFAENISRKQ
jgi:hypothetical protein